MALFSVASPEQHRAFLAQYRLRLRDRDGLPDPRALTLSRREEQLEQHRASAAARPWASEEDRRSFSQNQLRKQPEAELNERMLWALALAKINRGESFGIQYKISHQGVISTDIHSIDLHIEIEELYHTQTIPIVLRYIGLDATILEPTWWTRQFLVLLIMAPRLLADILLMSAEVVGVATFRCLIEEGRRIFSDQPTQFTPMDNLLNRVLDDEIGHVLYVRGRLSAWQLRVAQALLPFVARAILADTPELFRLLGWQRFIRQVQQVQLENLVEG